MKLPFETRATVSVLVVLLCNFRQDQDLFSAPAASKGALEGLKLTGKSVGERFKSRFKECDTKDTCDGKPLRYGCHNDPNRNSTLLRLKGGVIFYDAKMGVDTDGSPYSQKTPGETDQRHTSLRYPSLGRPSVNADRVSFVVIPKNGFDRALGVQLGDVAAVVYKGKRVFAVVADEGPACKIGEGSIELHESIGHSVCKQRASNGDCLKVRNVGVEKDVLYFIFPYTHKDLLPGLTPENINTRIGAIGSTAWQELIAPLNPSNRVSALSSFSIFKRSGRVIESRISDLRSERSLRRRSRCLFMTPQPIARIQR